MGYEDLLKRAQNKISDELISGERFEVPKAKIFTQGNNTIIKNFTDIASKLDRDKKHFLKYLLKELAAPGEIKGKRAKIQGKIRKEKIDKKIEDYIKEFVTCPICGKPDTKLKKEGNLTKMKCDACGSERVVKKV